MARSDGYNTKTRQLILDYLIRNRQHAVSASNILEHLEAEGASPNPTTVYRYLDKLAGEQRIMKYVADKGEKAVFQYVDEGRHCREHLHLKCVQCGRIYHLDCHFMDEVRAHLLYLLFFAVPLLGWAYSSAAGFPIVFLGLWQLPDFVAASPDLADALKPLHKLSAYAMAALVLVHVAAALKHQFFDRDGLMLRMLPGRR